MGTFRDDSAGFTVTGPCSCGGSLYTRGAALIPRQISSARASEEVKPGMAWHGGTHGVFRFCEGNARSLHEPFDFHISGISFAVQLYSQQLRKNFSTTPNHFHAPKMVVFVETEYIYKPTPSRSKSTTSRRNPGPEQLSILNKLQHIKSSGASLSTPRPAAAAAADDDESYSPGIQGM